MSFIRVDMNSNNEKYDVVFLWKQNDSGIYGRRADMMLKELYRCEWVDKIVEFDAPIDIEVLESYKLTSNQKKNTHYELIHDNAFRAFYGNKDIYGVKAYTYIYSRRGSKKANFATMDFYFDYVHNVLEQNGIGKENKVILWNCPINYELKSWIDYLQPFYVVSDIIDDQRAWSQNETNIQKMTDNYRYSIDSSNLILVNCQEMYNRVLEMDRNVKYKIKLIPNGCESFNDEKRDKPELLKNMKGPIIGQVSNLEKKIDIELLEKCAQSHPDWNIVLIGSVHANDDIAILEKYNNIYLTGPIPYEDVKNYISNFDVAIIAHRITKINQAMNPLKLYVYCSLGATVVATDIPGIDDLKEIIHVAHSHEEFIKQIESALVAPHRYTDEDIKLVNKFSWKRKVEDIIQIIRNTEIVNVGVSTPVNVQKDEFIFNGRIKTTCKEVLFKIPGLSWSFRKWKGLNDRLKDVDKKVNDQVRGIEERIKNQRFFLLDRIEEQNARLLQLEARIQNLENGIVSLNLNKSNALSAYSEKNECENLDELKVQNLRTTMPFVTIIAKFDSFQERLEETIKNILESTGYDNFEMVVLLTNSDYQNQLKNNKVKVIFLDDQENATETLNKIALQADSQYVLFLNNISYLSDNWLQEMLNVSFSSDSIGVVGAKLYFENFVENEFRASFSVGKIQFSDKVLNNIYSLVFDFCNTVSDELKNNRIESACVWGNCILVNKSIFEDMGGLCEIFTREYEGVDLSLRLYKNGMKNYVCQNVGALCSEKSLYDEENYNIFRCRWQSYLTRQIFLDKIRGSHLISKHSLVIGIAGMNSDSIMLQNFIQSCEQKHYIIKYINDDVTKENAVGLDVDLLIVVDGLIRKEKIKTKKNDLYTFLWIANKNIKDISFVAGNQWTMIFCENTRNLYDGSGQVVSSIRNCSDRLLDKVIDHLKNKNSFLMEEKTIDILGGMPADEEKLSWGDYHYALSLKRELEKAGYSVNVKCYPQWFEKSNSKYVLVLRGMHEFYPKIEGQVNIMWNISHPADVRLDEYNAYDWIYVASNTLAEKLYSKVTVPVKTLLQCTDETIMKYDENSNKKYELLFIGNSRGVYRKIIQDLLPTSHRLTVYGRAWDSYIPKEYIAGTYYDNSKIGQAYHDAAIVLNDHWDDMREAGLVSNRLFDALAVGAFVISDDIPEINEIFNGAVVTYKNRDDLKNIVEYYLSHPNEREEKAKVGQEIVLKEHTFKNRAEVIVADLELYNSNR